MYQFTLLHIMGGGGGVLKSRIAFDALLDPLGVKIERWYFLTIPKYKVGKNYYVYVIVE